MIEVSLSLDCEWLSAGEEEGMEEVMDWCSRVSLHEKGLDLVIVAQENRNSHQDPQLCWWENS